MWIFFASIDLFYKVLRHATNHIKQIESEQKIMGIIQPILLTEPINTFTISRCSIGVFIRSDVVD